MIKIPAELKARVDELLADIEKERWELEKMEKSLRHRRYFSG